MNPLFIATPPEADVAKALGLWSELAGKRIRPLLVTALGDIYVETEGGRVLVADPLALECSHVADSTQEMEQLFSDSAWAQERLFTQLLLLANERGITRAAHQVFAAAPHPCLSGKLRVEHLMPMDLPAWHHVCSQFRGA
jgi:hypothetical protein